LEVYVQFIQITKYVNGVGWFCYLILSIQIIWKSRFPVQKKVCIFVGTQNVSEKHDPLISNEIHC
jgi:hypothetical protein